MTQPRFRAVVFLDIDDVFCIHPDYSSYQALEALKRQDSDYPGLWENLVLPEARSNLGEIHLEFSPTYVISSSWSYGLSLEQMKQVFIRTKMGFIADDLHKDWCTPKLEAPSRIKEIEAWLSKHKQPKRPFLILDDYSSGWSLQDSRLDRERHVVFCDVGVGFNAEKLTEAQNLLREQLETLRAGVKKTEQKILYLDFDGVLHDEAVYFHPRRGIYIETEDRTLFEWMPILENLLSPYPDVSIVLSTSWVRARDYEFARKQLSPSLQARVIGATFHSRVMQKEEFARKSRGEQIAEDVARRAPDFWFALDDEYLDWPKSSINNLIRTHGEKGISDPAVQASIRRMLAKSL